MATNDDIHTADTIERAVKAPLDWGKFEALAHAVLVADDLPTLRRIGGVGDLGMDAVEEAFFDAARRVTTVVQVTSAQGQRAKVGDTLAKLKKNGIDLKTLIFFTRHPVSAGIRAEMIEEADRLGVALDVRDESYLVAQLGKQPSTFLRFFGSTKAQIKALLGQPDPLRAASDRLQHALLATLGAYVLSDHARMARGALFEKTVLAALAATPEGRGTRGELLQDVRRLLPGEEILAQQIDSAVEKLCRSGDCSLEGDAVVCAEPALKRCLDAANAASAGFGRLFDHILGGCRGSGKLSDAQLGYIERNLRRSIVQLLRVTGPLKTDDGALDFGAEVSNEVQDILAADLPPDIGRAVLLGFAAFVEDRTKAASLAPLVRSYAALAMRNLDPVGRQWQQSVLSRSIVALDTDALLHVIVEELPEHSAVLAALKRLQAEGVEILVPEHVFAEAVGHLGRAPRTYRRFADRLLRFPSSIVDGHVWHAVVRGYYYAKQRGYGGTFEQYYAKYYLPENSSEYTEHLLSKRLPLKQVSLDQAPAGAENDLFALEQSVLEYRERSRRKASFRDPVEMSQRVRADVAMALTLASRSSDQMAAPAKGYVASSDRAFRLIEAATNWKPRKPVHLWTSALPELSFFSCGGTLAPQDTVELLFNPVTIAAADQMGSQINLLTSIGVDLKEVPLDRLDWDLRHSLKAKLDDLGRAVVDATTDDDTVSAIATLDVARAASEAGYTMVPQVATLIREFDSASQTLSLERQRREAAEEQLRSLVRAAREQSTSKARRRFNRLLGDLGIQLDDDADAHDDDVSH